MKIDSTQIEKMREAIEKMEANYRALHYLMSETVELIEDHVGSDAKNAMNLDFTKRCLDSLPNPSVFDYDHLLYRDCCPHCGTVNSDSDSWLSCPSCDFKSK